MIVGFGDAATEDIYHGRDTARVRGFPADVVRVARRKLDMMDAAHSLQDLGRAPGNRLEQLKGKLQGFWSIRVNDQFRLVFRWDRGVHEVKLTDYH